MKEQVQELNDYQELCLRTCVTIENEKMAHLAWSLALAGEAGELANLTKKVFIHGHPYNPDRVIEELGDILWYIAVYAHEIGINLSEVATRNIAKLKSRYPEGFSSDASIRRKD